MKKQKLVSPLLVPVIIGIMAVTLLLSLVLPDRSFSQTENRTLARSADLSAAALMDGSGQKQLNSVFSDQFPGRNLFFHMNYLLRKTAGQKEINDVFLGHGALLANPQVPEEAKWSANSQAVSEFAGAIGLPCSVLIAPPASMIQADKLPANAPAVSLSQSMDVSFGAVAPAVPVDIRPMMGEHASEYIYYRTDHHWTTLGAGYGALVLLQSLGITADLNSYNRMPVSGSFEGTLASKTGSVFLRDTIEIAVYNQNPEYVVTWADGSKTGSIYDLAALDQKDQYELFLSKNQSVIRIDCDNDSDRHLLLFKDSYANSMIQYLLPYYRSITIIDPRYYYEDLDLVLSSGEITECAFVYSADTWNTITSLQDVLQTYTSVQQPAQS